MTSLSGEAGRDTIDHSSGSLDLVTDAGPPSARHLRIRFQQWLQALGAAGPAMEDLVLAVYEALANVVEHAYPRDHPHPVMRLRAQVAYDQVLIAITDSGRWRTAPAGPSSRGRGLAMMRYLAAELHLHRGAHGTTVHLRAALPAMQHAAAVTA